MSTVVMYACDHCDKRVEVKQSAGYGLDCPDGWIRIFGLSRALQAFCTRKCARAALAEVLVDADERLAREAADTSAIEPKPA